MHHLDDSPPTSSFPSGHTAASTAYYLGTALIIAWHTRQRLAALADRRGRRADPDHGRDLPDVPRHALPDRHRHQLPARPRAAARSRSTRCRCPAAGRTGIVATVGGRMAGGDRGGTGAGSRRRRAPRRTTPYPAVAKLGPALVRSVGLDRYAAGMIPFSPGPAVRAAGPPPAASGVGGCASRPRHRTHDLPDEDERRSVEEAGEDREHQVDAAGDGHVRGAGQDSQLRARDQLEHQRAVLDRGEVVVADHQQRRRGDPGQLLVRPALQLGRDARTAWPGSRRSAPGGARAACTPRSCRRSPAPWASWSRSRAGSGRDLLVRPVRPDADRHRHDPSEPGPGGSPRARARPRRPCCGRARARGRCRGGRAARRRPRRARPE